MLQPDELQKLKDRLPKGYFKKTIEKSKMSERSVANFYNGTSYNLTIHEAALDLAEENEQRLNSAMERSKSIIDAR